MPKPVTLYLIHAEIPYKHAGHYLGITSKPTLLPRMEEHFSGQGSSLVRLMAEALGIVSAQEIIERMVVASWPGTRSEERRLKNRGGLARICPLCRVKKGLGPYQPRAARQGKRPSMGYAYQFRSSDVVSF